MKTKQAGRGLWWRGILCGAGWLAAVAPLSARADVLAGWAKTNSSTAPTDYLAQTNHPKLASEAIMNWKPRFYTYNDDSWFYIEPWCSTNVATIIDGVTNYVYTNTLFDGISATNQFGATLKPITNYVEFTFNVSNGYKISFTNMLHRMQNDERMLKFDLRSDVDGYTYRMFEKTSFAVPGSPTVTLIETNLQLTTNSFRTYTNVISSRLHDVTNSTVKLRLYGTEAASRWVYAYWTNMSTNVGTPAYGNSMLVFEGEVEPILDISPRRGPYVGGTEVRITNVITGAIGDGGDITNLAVGGAAVPLPLLGQGTNWVRWTMPPASSAGAKDILIQSTSVGDTLFEGEYTYNGPGSIDSVDPATGDATGGVSVTIAGTNLCDGTDVTNVTICGVAATSFDSQSVTQIVVTAGAGAAGLGDVRVWSTSYGASVLSNAFTYTNSGPQDQTITDFLPTNGSEFATTDEVGLSATASSGLAVTFAVGAGPGTIAGGTNLTFTGAGSVSIVASQAGDANWNAAPDVTNTFTVAKAAATVYLGDLAQTYDGTARMITATTMPAGLTVEFTYDGSATAPTAAGSYAVTGTVNEVMYQGSVADTLVVGKAAATVYLSDLSQTYDGTARTASATTMPAGLTVEFTYDGSATAPTDAGTYAVTGTVNDANYQGFAADSLAVGQAAATVYLQDLSQPYDGTARTASATTMPAGLTVEFTYDGSATAPTNVGTYAVTGTVNEVNYQGSAADSLVVGKADQTIAFPAIADKVTTDEVGLAATASSGLAVTFAVGAGPGTIAGGTNLTFTGAGSVLIVASQAGDANWNAAPDETNTFTVAKAAATVYLGDLSQTYDGTARTASATTMPAGLAVEFTYDGSATAPTAAGSYAVTGTVNEVMYQGSAADTLVVGKAAATVYLGDLAQTYDGTARTITATTMPAGLTVEFTYDGSATAPTDAGTHAVTGTVNDVNYQGYAADALVVGKAAATVFLGNLAQTYDGTARTITATTMPAGLTVEFTYNGSATAPTNVGTYAVTGTVSDVNYQGSAADTLAVGQAAATVYLQNLSQAYDGTTRTITATTMPAGLTVEFTYDGHAWAPTNVGTYAVTGTVNDSNYQGSAADVLVVGKGSATVFLLDLAQTYDGTARTITATTMPAGLTVEITYDGGTAAPTNGGTYAVTGTVNDTMYQGSAADSLVVGKADQTISFDPIVPQKRSAAVGLAATASSGLAVSFSADPPGAIAGGTNLTFTTAGDVVVVATQAGDASWNPAPNITNVVKVFSVTPDNGPLAGDISVTISNGQFGTITNVLVAGDAAPFVQGGSSWFTVTLPAASDAGVVDFTVQTSDLGEITLADAYGYHPAGRIGIREDDWTQWEEVAGLPAPRAGLAAATWNGLLYAIGGRDGVTYDRTNMFAFNGTSWQEMAGLPTQRYYLAVGTLNGKMHQVAGWAGGAVTSVFRYNGTNWLNVAALPTSMAYNAAATWGGELYSIGGVSGAFAQSNVFRYNGTNWSVAAGLPGRRHGLAAATLGGAIYALGGNDELNNYHSNVYRYAGTDWQEVAGFPAPRFELAAATLGDSLYAIGGRDGSGPRTNVYRFDGTNWQEVASLPTARYELAAATYDDAIYAFGGRNGSGTFTTNVYRYPKFMIHPGISPASGSGTGGYQVVISGTNLGDGEDITNVTLGGVSAAILPGQSATQVVVTAGTAGAAGLGDVRVFSTSFGETVASNAFEYLRVEQAALAFAPASPQAFGATNGLSTSGGSGTGAVSYAVQSGPGLIVGGTNLAVTAGAGDVVVVATKAQDDLYFAIAATATVAAAKADQTIDFPAIGDQVMTDAVGLAATASSGLPVSFAVGAGPASIADLTNLTFTGTGAVSIVASQAGAADWNAAPDATNTFNVGKASATVYLLDLAQTYDGTARTITATTMPAGLTVEFTYAGSASAPTNAGSYAVTGTVNDANWQGSAAGLLVVGRAFDTITFFETNQFYDGTARPVIAVIGSGSPVTLTYDGLPWAPTNVGVYSVTGVVDEANWQAIGAEHLTVFKGNQVITNFLPADGAQFVLGSATTVSAQAESGLGVAFENLTPEIADLVGTDIAFTNPGVAQVRATQAGDANWNAAAPVVHQWRVGGLITNVAPGAANVGGGIEVTIQGVALGAGADITNVTLCGVAATIVTQSVGDVTVTVEPAAAAATGDVTVASATGGFMVLSNAFEYLWLAAPAMRPATDVTLYDLTAHWTGVAGATAYFLDVGLDAGFAAHLPGYELRNMGAATNASVDGLLDETDYWLRAYSWNAAGRSLASPSVAVSTPAVADFDFDADGRADLAAYQTATGDWKFRSFETGATWSDHWGWSNAVPVPADYDGDGVSDVAVYQPATGIWRIRYSTGGPMGVIPFGWSATVPVPADYDGDGTADLAVYHAASGRWYFRCSTEGDYDVSWGWSAAVPVPADYDGDGKTDLAVYHPATGDWYVLKSLTQTLLKIQWGWHNAVPVPGDYEGDGKADIAVFHRASGNWHIRYSSGIQWQVLTYGWAGTIPVQADYDGDGTTDRAIYHPTTGNWSIRRSSIGTDAEFQLGGPGHVPVLPYPLIHAWFGLP